MPVVHKTGHNLKELVVGAGCTRNRRPAQSWLLQTRTTLRVWLTKRRTEMLSGTVCWSLIQDWIGLYRCLLPDKSNA
jgi:hypothetical protein